MLHNTMTKWWCRPPSLLPVDQKARGGGPGGLRSCASVLVLCFVLSLAELWQSMGVAPMSSSSVPSMDRLTVNNEETLTQASVATPSVIISNRTCQHLVGNKPHKSRGRVFYCGWFSNRHFLPDYDKPLEVVDPTTSYTPDDILLYSKNQNANQPRPCPGFKSPNPDDLLEHFPGKILYINGEWYTVNKEKPLEAKHTIPPNNRIFQIGAFAPLSSSSTMSSSSLQTHNNLNHTFAVHYMVIYHTKQLGHHIIDYLKRFQRLDRNEGYTKRHQARGNQNNPNGNKYERSKDLSRPAYDGTYHGVAYFTSNCVAFRQEAARRLSSILTIYYGGGCRPPVSLNDTINSNEMYNNSATLNTGRTDNDNSNSQIEDNNNNKKDRVEVLDDSTTGIVSSSHRRIRQHASSTRSKFKKNHELYSKYKYCLVVRVQC